MRTFARRHPLAVFVALAYAVSWAYWIPMALNGVRVTPGGAATHFPGLLGPAIAACITTALVAGRQGLRELTRRLWLVSRPPARFWLYSLSPLAFLAVALLVAALLDASPRYRDFTRFSGLPPLPLPAVLALVLIFNGFGEEIGWRGFALPILQARFGFVRGALAVAAIWAGWHIPAFWTIEGYRSMTLPVLIGGFGVGLACGSIVLARISNVTGGSILAAALWHLTYNMSAATAASRGVVGAVSTACVEVWAVALVLMAIRRTRVRGSLPAAA